MGREGAATMANKTTCLKCGAPLAADARQGFCPKCLFAQASAEPEGGGQKSEVRDQKAEAELRPASDLRSLPLAFGDYELLEEIARGGMGIVYRARQVSLGRIVAVKMLLSGPLSSPELLKRFRAEASAAASLQHPNIVAIHEVGVHQGQQYFAMDYVEGPSLAKLISDFGLRIADFKRAARYLKTIAEAIHYAHERGILHRDLKPSNVLIDASDQPRVTDFGLARRLEGGSELTVTGQVLGSPNYMPPEQATAKRGKVSRRSDVYSLGAMFYHVLAGRPPFLGGTLTDTLDQVLNVEPVSTRLLNPSVPRDLETICLKCLEKEPEKRYATAQALADELGRFLNHEPVHARPVTRVERVWRWCRRKPALASLVVALHLVFALGLAGVFWQWRRAELNATREASERARAEQESLKARQYAYASDMNLAQQAVQADELDRALQLLNRHRPNGEVTSGKWRLTSEAANQPRGSAPLVTRHPPPVTDLRGWEWRYLWRQCQGEERFILGEHANGATAVGLLADGKTVFSAGGDKLVRLWDLESRRPVGQLPHPEAVSGAAASPDGRWLATTTEKEAEGQPVLLWDLATQKIAATLTTITPDFTNFWLLQGSISFSPDSKWLAFATMWGGVRLWNVDPLREFPNLPATNTLSSRLGLAFSPNSRTLACNEDDNGVIRLWDLASRSVIGRLKGHQSVVTALAFSPDGQTLASGSDDRTAKLWNLAERRERFTFTNASGGFTSLAFSPDGRNLAITGEGGAGRIIRLVDVATGKTNAELRGHLHAVSDLAFTTNGQSLLSASADDTLRVWDVTPPAKEKFAHEFARNSISEAWTSYGPALCLSPDGRHLLTVYTNQTFSIWDTQRLVEGERHPLPFTNTTIAAVAAGGRLAAFASRRGEVVLWDVATSQRQFFAQLGTNNIRRLVFSFDGRQLAAADEFKKPTEMSGSNDDPRRTVRVWDVGDRRETHVLSPEGQFLWPMVFSADGKRLIAGTWRGEVKLWHLDGPGEPVTFPRASGSVDGLALLPDGRTLISAGAGIHFWNVRTRHETDTINPRSSGFTSVALSPDGRRLAAGAGDGRITIWDLASHQEVATLEGHPESVMQLAFTPEGDHLVSASKDQLRVWRAASWAEIEASEKESRRADRK